MGKLVFGIITVALLEIAFIGYAVIGWEENAVINEVRAPLEKGLELARVDDIPEFEASVPEVAESRSDSARAWVATNRARVDSVPYTRARHANRIYITPTDVFATTTVIRTGPGIPSGYTMVLVDYLPGAGSDNKPKITYFTSRPKAKSS